MKSVADHGGGGATWLGVGVGTLITFDKERLHNAVAFENFGPFIDTNLGPNPKNCSGASTVSCPISGHFLQNCNILPQNSTNELKFSHNVASTAGK